MAGFGVSDQEEKSGDCWLPPTYRPLEPTVGENIVVARDIVGLLADSGRVAVLECRE